MHTSTSPQYAIIASCDVAAAMMEPPGGTRWWRRASSRRWTSAAPCARSTRTTAKDWWFKVWGRTRWRLRASANRDDWMLRQREKWHGFGDLAEGFNMLDPIKSTIITPGLDVTGKFAKTGIPASIVTKFLPSTAWWSRRRAVQFFIMFTIGITKGRWNTLLTALQQFKDDYANQPMWKILLRPAPALRAHGPARPVPEHPRDLREMATSRG